MRRVLAIQHTFSEFLGALEPQLEAREIGFTYVRPAVGEDVHGLPSQYDALFLLGGAHAAADSEHCPWLADEQRLVRAFEKARRPVVGFGIGAHVIASAHGAVLSAAPEHTALFTTARALDPRDPVAQAVDGRRVLVMANGSARLSGEIEPIVASGEGECIGFRVGALTYGILFRPELKPGMLEDMAMEEERPVPDALGELIETSRALWGDMEETTARVAAALVQALGLMDERRKMPVFPLAQGR